MKKYLAAIMVALVCIKSFAQYNQNDYQSGAVSLLEQTPSGPQLKVPTNTVLVTSLVTPVVTAGSFNLFFTDPANVGFNSTVSGLAYRTAAAQVFTDLSKLIIPAQQAYNIGAAPFTNIELNGSNTGFGASGMPYFFEDFQGIMDPAAWLNYNGGFDPYYNSKFNGQNSTSLYKVMHGKIAVNFTAITWYAGTVSTAIPPTSADLYSAILHEALHVLGFASSIGFNGQTRAGWGYQTGQYSRYDDFLFKTPSNVKVLNPTCYNTAFSSTATTAELIPPACKIMFKGTTNKIVYTRAAWSDGTSLSHLDPSGCGGDLTSIMQDNLPFGVVRRHPSQDEKNILSDLGFYTTNTYGTGSTYGGAAFTYTGPVSVRICGVNDYFYFNTAANAVSTSYNVVQGSSIVINDFLQNDDDNGATPTKFECLSVFSGGGTAVANGTMITYTPATGYSGLVILTYVPVSSTGVKGNVTAIFIHVESNYPCNTNVVCEPNSNCNLICDGGFESYTSTDPMLLQSPALLADFSLGGQNSPDVYVNPPSNCNWPGQTSICYGYQQCGWSGTTPADRGFPNCKNYVGLVSWTEGIKLKTKTPLLVGKTYKVTLWARSACGLGQLLVNASGERPCFSVPTNVTMPSTNCGGYTYVPEIVGTTGIAIPSTAWTLYTWFYTPTSSDKNFIMIYTNSTPGTAYTYLDDVMVTEVPTFDVPPMVCSGSPAITLRARPLGGTFSGPYVAGNTFVPPVVAVQTVYTLTYTTSCGATVTQTVIVNPGSCPCGVNLPTTISSSLAYNLASLNIVAGTTTISGAGTVVLLNKCNVSIAAGATINLTSGATLQIQNTSYLHACTDMWAGITVNPGCTLIVDNSIIEDAVLAIKSVGGAYFITKNGTRLNKNRIAIELSTYSGALHPAVINNTTISCYNSSGVAANALITPYAGQKSLRGINIVSVNQAQIGLDQGGQGNIIDNQQTGIYSSNSSLTVYNTSFNNITASTGASWGIRSYNTSGVEKTLTVGGNANAYQKNYFFNSTRGVSVNSNQDVNIIGNRFDNLTTGTELYYCNSTSISNRLIVNNNIINDCTTGIFGQDLGSCISTFVAKDNLINLSPAGLNSKPNSTGVRIANTALNNYCHPVGIFDIENNIIDRVSNGIWVTNMADALIYSNTITNISDLTSGGGMQNGILAEGSFLVFGIRNNYIKGVGTNLWYQSGIRLETTVSPVVYNTVDNIGRGLFFGSVCTGSEIAKNLMKNNYSGFFLNYGIVGEQLSGGRATENSWWGTFPESHLYSYNSTGSSSLMNVLLVNGQCDPVVGPCTDPINIRSLPTGIAQIPVNRSSIYSGWKQSDPKRDFYLKIAKDEINFPVYDASAKWMSKYNVYKNLQADDSTYKVDEPELKWFADSVASSTMGNLYNAGKLLANNNGSMNAMQTTLNSTTPGNVIEQNLKDVYAIIISSLNNDNSLSKAEIKKLQTIAVQCPYEGGPAVYNARVLLSPLDNTAYNTDCEKGKIVKSGLKLAPSDTDMVNSIVVYPNPANDLLNVVVHLEEHETGTLIVYDITGKLVLSSKFEGNNGSQISTTSLSEGLYLYKIFVNNSPVSTGKLSIIR